MDKEERIFLSWLADRLVFQYHEHEGTDFVLRLRQISRDADPSNMPGKFATVIGRDSTHHYEKWVEELWGDSEPHQEDRTLGIVGMGLAGEGAELLEELWAGQGLIRGIGPLVEAAKKHVRNGRAVDRDKFCSEAGDILYYLVKLLHWQKLTLTDAMEANIQKVNGRYLQQEREMPTFERETVCNACFIHGEKVECEVCGGRVQYTETVQVPPELYEKIRKGEV